MFSKTHIKVYVSCSRWVSWDLLRELLGGTEENSVSPEEGSSNCPPSKSMIFTYMAPLIFDCLRHPWTLPVASASNLVWAGPTPLLLLQGSLYFKECDKKQP